MPKLQNPLLWNYFETKPDIKMAECKQCHKELSYKTTSGNLKHHLKIKHVSSYDELMENDSSSSLKKPRLTFPKSNNLLIWNYFEQDADGEGSRIAGCRLCRKKLSYKTTIGNLKQHLKKQHVSSYKEFVERGESAVVNLSEDDCLSESVWSYFTKKADYTATCNTCSQDYSYRAGTSNLRKHWHNKHGKYLEGKCNEPSENNSDNSDEEQEKPVTPLVNKTKSMDTCQYFDSLDLENRQATCKICDTIVFFRFMTDLTQHVRDHGHEPKDSDDEFVPEVQEKTLKRRQFKSKVWKYFRAIDDKIAKCLVCHNPLNYASSISNLRKHLMRKHGDAVLTSEGGEDEPKEMDIIYLNEELLEEDSSNDGIKPPTPKKKLVNIPPKRKPSISKVKEQVHSTRDTCSKVLELPSTPAQTYAPNTMGSIDYFGQYVISLLKELPKPVSDQLQSEIINQILTSKMALQSKMVVDSKDVTRWRNNEKVLEQLNNSVIETKDGTENLKDITEIVINTT